MTNAEKQLLEVLKERSFRLGTFRLASGATSNYYIDGKMTEVFSRGAHLIGEVLFEHTKDLQIDAIGGMEVGAVPLTAAAVISYHLRGQVMEGFWVRDAVKDHGTRKLIEGRLERNWRVAIVEDVITSGSSTVKAINAVRELGGQVVRVIALVDRLAGAAQALQQQQIDDYRPVFTIRDLGVDV